MTNLKNTQNSNDLLSAEQHLMQIDHQLSTIYDGKAVGEFPAIQKRVAPLKRTVEEIGHRIKNQDDTSVIQELYARVMETITSILSASPKAHRVTG